MLKVPELVLAVNNSSVAGLDQTGMVGYAGNASCEGNNSELEIVTAG